MLSRATVVKTEMKSMGYEIVWMSQTALVNRKYVCVRVYYPIKALHNSKSAIIISFQNGFWIFANDTRCIGILIIEKRMEMWTKRCWMNKKTQNGCLIASIFFKYPNHVPIFITNRLNKWLSAHRSVTFINKVEAIQWWNNRYWISKPQQQNWNNGSAKRQKSIKYTRIELTNFKYTW